VPMIVFSCPECGEALQVADDLAGRRIKCRECNESLRVPDAGVRATRAPGSPVPVVAVAAGGESDAVRRPLTRNPIFWCAVSAGVLLLILTTGLAVHFANEAGRETAERQRLEEDAQKEREHQRQEKEQLVKQEQARQVRERDERLEKDRLAKLGKERREREEAERPAREAALVEKLKQEQLQREEE